MEVGGIEDRSDRRPIEGHTVAPFMQMRTVRNLRAETGMASMTPLQLVPREARVASPTSSALSPRPAYDATCRP